MSNHWLRLWHEMPHDPKWRTIARHSGQPISLVQAVYLHLLVDASRNVTRGHASVTNEDLASALDCDESQIDAVLGAMQGRVLEGMAISGWEKRQPKREDAGNSETRAKTASQRKREQRERDRESRNVTQCHDESRNVTTDKDKDKDTERAEEANASLSAASQRDDDSAPDDDNSEQPGRVACPHQQIVSLYHEVLPELRQVRDWNETRRRLLGRRWSEQPARQDLEWWRGFFGYVRESDFLMGKTIGRDGRPFDCDLEWLVRPTNFAKVIEGKYENDRA
ncbi:hypothetical protein [Stenotrophomonas pictorum]|nr:hypothetical protein [Stenotrophomonas pictorum]